jgi:LPS export ABC transporter protein LptC
MSKRTLTSLIVLAVLTLLSIWVFFSDSTPKSDTSNQENASQATKDENVKIKDLIITETKEGKKFWEVVAATGTYDKNSSKITLTDINGNFYKDNVVVLSVQAPLAIYDSSNKEVTMKNGARAANSKGVYLTAKEIKWAGTTDLITSTGNVKITQNGKMRTTSDKSIFNTDFTYLKLNGRSDSYMYR